MVPESCLSGWLKFSITYTSRKGERDREKKAFIIIYLKTSERPNSCVLDHVHVEQWSPDQSFLLVFDNFLTSFQQLSNGFCCIRLFEMQRL